MASHPTIAVTAGEPAGIGPDLIAMLAARHAKRPFPARLIVLGDEALLHERAQRIDVRVGYARYDPLAFAPVGGAIEVWNQPLAAPAVPGHPDPTNARSVLSMLEAGCDGCATGAFAALVTGPVQKSAIQDAGIPFSGHTEFFAERTHSRRVVMMLTGVGPLPLRVALVTTHLPLRDVAAAITFDAVTQTLAIVRQALIERFGVARPRLAVLGLNPHAGEGGHLGREDIEIVAPAIEAARNDGADIEGPIPADTAFVPNVAQRFDAIVAMYHDQGLPVVKAATFGHGVNITLGLPFVRTSVDHGTALDLAADPARARTADVGSFVAAVDLAIELAARTGA